MEAILRAIAEAAALVQQASILIPQIEANYKQVKDAIGSHDDAAVRQQIDTLHAQTNALTAQLDALRDKPAPVVAPAAAASGKA